MKKILTLFSIIFAVAIFFYPTTSNSNATGSPGGKTGSPTDGASCTDCHYAGVGTGATITTNIPSSGYVPNQVYTITANINQSGINKFGFEITAEESNFGSAKTGSFLVTNSNETKFVNNNDAITHKSGGTSGSNLKSWSMDWEAPNTGTGAVTFFGSFMAANADGTNSGDTYHSATLSVNEGIVNSTNNLSSKNQIIFNSMTKTIELIDNSELLVYNMTGKLLLSSNKKYTSLSHLPSGIYLIKTENNSKKVLIY
ncbi:T9SS type A sorting domain-containing protein [Flavobacteriales bacterium]|nr:T9SS type A sorting domain-containing protein [Flavobacteriales bacterium]